MGLTAIAPAKLNLFLHVTGRRPDGLHELQTLFQFLDWGDELTFTPRPAGIFERGSQPQAVPPESDLTLRAARLLAEHTGTQAGIHIQVAKRLPIGAGLGSGSSDAATTLIALNRLWECGLTRGELIHLGVRLGADVPVFIGGRAAWAEGIGEHLTSIAGLPEAWYLVVWPGEAQVATREIFQAPHLTRNHPMVTIKDFFQGRCRNDLAPVVEEKYPEIARVRAWLQRKGNAPVQLTGSGACLFCPCESHEQAQQLVQQIPASWIAVPARAMNQHPHIDWVSDSDGA